MTAPALKQYLITHNVWTDRDFNNINWPVHGQAFRRKHKIRNFLVKYLHDHLPLGHHIIKYSATYNDTCPSCQEPDED